MTSAQFCDQYADEVVMSSHLAPPLSVPADLQLCTLHFVEEILQNSSSPPSALLFIPEKIQQATRQRFLLHSLSHLGTDQKVHVVDNHDKEVC